MKMLSSDCRALPGLLPQILARMSGIVTVSGNIQFRSFGQPRYLGDHWWNVVYLAKWATERLIQCERLALHG